MWQHAVLHAIPAFTQQPQSITALSHIGTTKGGKTWLGFLK